MKDITFKIEKQIWSLVDTENKVGLLNGLAGIALFYNYLYDSYKVEEFESKLIQVIEKINYLIENEYTKSSLCSGIAGYGLMLLRLKNNSIDIDEDYFANIDLILLEDFNSQCDKNEYDFLHGSIGIAMYFVERYRSSKNEAITNLLHNFSRVLIEKINNGFEEVLAYDTAQNYGKAYFFGLAHGVAGHLNFLTYLRNNFDELKEDITNPLRTCISFLESYKSYDLKSKLHYPNLFLLDSKNIINSRLSWCQGDLGISNALYNAAAFLKDDNLKNEAIELMLRTKHISLEDSGVKDFGMCHGSIGILMQYHLASRKYNHDFSAEISKWLSIIKQQTNDYTEFLVFNGTDYNEKACILEGLSGLGLSILTLDEKIDSRWLEILYLH